MQIAVACKIVPDDQDILVDADGGLDYSKAHLTVSAYDLNAIEASAQLAEGSDGRLVALTVGPSKINDSKVKKSVLSRGVDELFMLADDAFDDADPYATAQALKALIAKAGDVDLVVCGDGSADNYAQQVDAQLAEALRVPCVNGVVGMRLEGNVLVAERMLEEVLETVEVPLPAVVSVSPDVALPRICGMKEILAAGKKPAQVLSAAECGAENEATMAVAEVCAPQAQARKLEIYDSAVDGDIDKFVSALAEALR